MIASDHELVALARSGNRDAFGQLALKHRDRCVNMALVFMRNHFDAEDATQIAMLKAFERIHQFAGDSTFSTWLVRIVINECLMALRTIRRRRAVPLPRRLYSRDRNPEQHYAFRQLRQFVRTEVSHVPRLLRPALAHDLEDLTVPQLARRLKLTIAAAKSRLFRARAELRTRIERRMYDNMR